MHRIASHQLSHRIGIGIAIRASRHPIQQHSIVPSPCCMCHVPRATCYAIKTAAKPLTKAKESKRGDDMNQAERCHAVDGCPGLYVDAFKTFRGKTRDASSSFVLTHYHADHYNSLPRDGAYAGPALIHCTPVTAALLRSVHGVAPGLIVEHSYGESWVHKYACSGDDTSSGAATQQATITFYDANHCPGAAIVLIQLPDGRVHLHTGDMRYHPRMKDYPLLKKIASDRSIDLLYLDTTYSHPKHTFLAQEEAVDSIASQVVEIFQQSTTSTLVLLSCYSIGKEKVLWECAKRTNKSIFVNERKHMMLTCIQDHKCVEESSTIIDRCTQKEGETDIHVIPMGKCGEMWPYFRPNYNESAKYADKVGSMAKKRYDRVVAFIPTGWADATNWNKKNAVSNRRVDVDKIQNRVADEKTEHFIDAEIRLIPYSEHSTFPELCAFVDFLKPRKVIPTVFSDEKDYVKIEERFRDMIDSQRAKQMFVNSISSTRTKRAKPEKETQVIPNSKCDNASKSNISGSDSDVVVIDCSDDDQKPSGHRKVSTYTNNKKPRNDALCGSREHKVDDAKLATLISMGFDSQVSRDALGKSNGDIDRAIESLLHGDQISSTTLSTSSDIRRMARGSRSGSSASNSSKKKQSPSSITNFFSPKTK